jgi:MFS family permease
MTVQQRRIAAATLIGTTIEWYDYFIYANAAALVFAHHFFKPAEGTLGTLISFGTVGISFLFRPVGAILSGWIGDRYGRRVVLLVTLLMMGAGTTLIGCLPTYTTIGMAAPVLLILLRIVQGLSAGGEWGGAALLAAEHAPPRLRGRFGAFPQMGVPVGMLLASAVTAVVSLATSDAAFLAWGWRIPFMLSVVLFGVGYFIRRRVAESPVFEELRAAAATERAPLISLFRRNPREIVQAVVMFMGNNASGYMLTGGFILGYATGTLHLDRSQILNFITIGSLAWLGSTWTGAVLSDRLGRRTVYLLGWVALLAWMFPLFLLIDTARPALVFAALLVFGGVLGFTSGPQAALYAEMFPARIRLSGASISYALGAVLGGAFAPTIAVALVDGFGTTLAVATYLFVIVALSLIATLTLRDRTARDLSPAGDDERPAQQIALRDSTATG